MSATCSSFTDDDEFACFDDDDDDDDNDKYIDYELALPLPSTRQLLRNFDLLQAAPTSSVYIDATDSPAAIFLATAFAMVLASDAWRERWTSLSLVDRAERAVAAAACVLAAWGYDDVVHYVFELDCGADAVLGQALCWLRHKRLVTRLAALANILPFGRRWSARIELQAYGSLAAGTLGVMHAVTCGRLGAVDFVEANGPANEPVLSPSVLVRVSMLYCWTLGQAMRRIDPAMDCSLDAPRMCLAGAAVANEPAIRDSAHARSDRKEF